MAPPESSGIYTKKEGLTLSQLASYDDLCTDVLVDKVSYFSLPAYLAFAIT